MIDIIQELSVIAQAHDPQSYMDHDHIEGRIHRLERIIMARMLPRHCGIIVTPNHLSEFVCPACLAKIEHAL